MNVDFSNAFRARKISPALVKKISDLEREIENTPNLNIEFQKILKETEIKTEKSIVKKISGLEREIENTPNLNIEFQKILKETEIKTEKSILFRSQKDFEEKKVETGENWELLTLEQEDRKVVIFALVPGNCVLSEKNTENMNIERIKIPVSNLELDVEIRKTKSGNTAPSAKLSVPSQILEILNGATPSDSMRDEGNVEKRECKGEDEKTRFFQNSLSEHMVKQSEKIVFIKTCSESQKVEEYSLSSLLEEKGVDRVENVEILQNKKSGNLRILHLQLVPEKLGKVYTRVRMTAEGLHVALQVENLQTARLLARDHFLLIRILEEASMRDRGNISVKIMDKEIASLLAKGEFYALDCGFSENQQHEQLQDADSHGFEYEQNKQERQNSFDEPSRLKTTEEGGNVEEQINFQKRRYELVI